jgi:hypothetical protein
MAVVALLKIEKLVAEALRSKFILNISKQMHRYRARYVFVFGRNSSIVAGKIQVEALFLSLP